jgi:adenylate kinase family enzyme
MKGPLTHFPVIKTTVPGLTTKFDLNDKANRKEYFEAKAGPEIAKLRKYFESDTFVAYLLGKKNSGKGTYTKLMAEIFGADKIGHISVGDLVRETHKIIEDPSERQKIVEYMEKNYRGYISIDEAIDALIGKSQKALLPTEFIMALVKRAIDQMGKKAVFLDGFPRDLDQVQYALYFRDLINYREDPDIFVAINIPESVLDERMRNRVVCPICQSPRNLTTFPTKEAGYDEKTKQFFLKCDNADCKGARMVGKEGDNAGIESIRERLELDDKLIKKVMSLHGIPKILLRNAIPVNSIKDGIVDDYEITPKYVFKHDEATGKVTIDEEAWVVKDDAGDDSYSLLAPPVVVGLIKQLVKALEL